MRAIVVGGGVAGLAAAKVLSSFYTEVILLSPRSAPQGKHLHVLLKQGQKLLEDIFPGTLGKLRELGCPEVDWARDTVWENHRGRFPRYRSSVKTLSMSRPLLEGLLLADLSERSSVYVIHASLKQLLREGGKVRGIVTDDGRSLDCDLLILAPGANFPLERLLGEGPVFQEKKLDIDLTYRSVLLPLDEVELPDCKQYYYQMVPPHGNLGGVISPVEDRRVLATLIQRGSGAPKPVQRFEDFLELARELPVPTFYRSLASAKPIGEVHTFHKKSIHTRTLELEKLPGRVLLMGDLLTSLNPVFGQGMTMALLQARMLRQQLQEGKPSAQSFYRSCLRRGRGPVFLSRVGSSGGPVIELLLRACQGSAIFHQGFLHVLHHPGGIL